jgi:hypothetical protein
MHGNLVTAQPPAATAGHWHRSLAATRRMPLPATATAPGAQQQLDRAVTATDHWPPTTRPGLLLLPLAQLDHLVTSGDRLATGGYCPYQPRCYCADQVKATAASMHQQHDTHSLHFTVPPHPEISLAANRPTCSCTLCSYSSPRSAADA